MTNLRLPSKRFQCFSVEENKQILVELIPPSTWVLEKDIEYSKMDKEEREFFDEIVPWKVMIDEEKTVYMPKKALQPFFEKEAEQR